MTEANALIWLMAACAIIWFGIGAYLAFLGFAQRSLKKSLRQLEQLCHDQQA